MSQENQKYKIAIIVTWFGPLPPYFDAWLTSAEANPDVDFLMFFDHPVRKCSENIKIHLTTMQDEVNRIATHLHEDIQIENSYKFCDLRAFFGIGYEEILQDYDFWGYCDIDLMFGNIRHFLTDEKLSKYDRFYQYGHLSVFRNTAKINHLYELPGGIYSKEEIFRKPAKTTPEEYFGINRICMKNNISWYTKADFADFCIWYPERLDVEHGLKNYQKQVFVWYNGQAYRVFEKDGNIKQEEFVYMHWQKRKPTIKGAVNRNNYIIITPNSLVSVDKLKEESIFGYNVELSVEVKEREKKEYFKKKLIEFWKANIGTKKIWIRQKLTKKRDGAPIYP